MLKVVDDKISRKKERKVQVIRSPCSQSNEKKRKKATIRQKNMLPHPIIAPSTAPNLMTALSFFPYGGVVLRTIGARAGGVRRTWISPSGHH